MNPEQMWRWLIHQNSVEKKVERALTEPSESIQKLQSKTLVLQEELIQAKLKSESREKPILEENKRLNAFAIKLEKEKDLLNGEIVKLSSEVRNLKKTTDAYSDEKANLLKKMSSLEAKLSAAFSRGAVTTDPNGVPKMKGKTVFIYFKDALAEKTYRLKTLLETFGARTSLRAGNQYGSKSNVLYYGDTQDMGLALHLRDVIGKEFGIDAVVAKDWRNDNLDFTIFVH